MPETEFEGLEILNNELMREFKDDKKGILDVRVKTKLGKQIDIEIQILPTEFMPQRTLYYWSKMYTGQVKPGDTYDKLKKCITINIVDYECIPVNKLHTVFHIAEDETLYKLTDVLEVHFLELPKLAKTEVLIKEDESIIEWMMFIDGESKGVMEMLSERNKNIKKAYDILQIISQDEKTRMIYEAREAEIKDQMTRIKESEEKGRLKGNLEGKFEVAKNLLLMGMKIEDIAKGTGLSEEEIIKIKKELN